MSTTESESRANRPLAVRILVVVISLVLPVAVIFGGLEVAEWMMATGPVATKKKPKRRARLVEVVPAAAGDIHTTVAAMGTVRAAREVVLRPRVAGEVVFVSERFLPGGRFTGGDEILRIDPRDYELEVDRRESELASARADVELEKGNQQIALSEFELLGQNIPEKDRALVLREPQLAKVKAKERLAENALETAKLALRRTTVRAPFDCVVRDRSVNLGTQVGTSTPLAALSGTSETWVEVSIPVEQLPWIELPERAGMKGAPAEVVNPVGNETHAGFVISLTPELETEGRMARLLVSVTDSPRHDGTGLIVGSYVRVEIEGRRLEGVFALDRRILRDDDSIWIMDGDGKLEIRPVDIEFRDRDRIYVRSGIRADELIVTSDLGAPVPGMPLRRAEDGAEPTGESPR